MRRESQAVASWLGGHLGFAHAQAGEDPASGQRARPGVLVIEAVPGHARARSWGRREDVQPDGIESTKCLGQGSRLRACREE